MSAGGKGDRWVFQRSRAAFGEWRQQTFGTRSLGRAVLRMVGVEKPASEGKELAPAMRQLAARNARLADDLERARQTIDHLRRLEAAFAAALDAAAQGEAALARHATLLEDTRRELKTAQDEWKGAQAALARHAALLQDTKIGRAHV